MTFEEQVREMNEEGVFKKMYQRELARGKIQSNQCWDWCGSQVHQERSDDGRLPYFG